MKKTIRKCVCIILSLFLLWGGMLPTIVPMQAKAITSAQAAANEKIIYDYCTQVMGYNTAVTVAILANVERECDFDPGCWGDNGNAYGIFQWNYRRNNLINWCSSQGLDYTDINAQLAFFRHELTGKDTYSSDGYYNKVHTKLKSYPDTAQGAYDAAYYFAETYEGCMSSDWAVRAVLARDTYWPKYSKIVDPTVTSPVNGSEISATSPGSLIWGAVPNALSYRYTIALVNNSNAVQKTIANNVLVSASVTSVSLLQSNNANLQEALQSGSRYSVKVVAYSDASGTKAIGSGTTLYFTTSVKRLDVPMLSSPAVIPTKYSTHYAGTYNGTISAEGGLSVVWTSTGNYYTYNVRILSGSPNPARANENGKDLYTTDQTRNANSLSLSADVLSKYAGKWIRLKIVAHSNISGEQSSLPVYYYFQRDQEIAGYTVSFDATGGKLSSYSQFVKKNESVKMPTAEYDPCYVNYIPNGGRCMPALQSFKPVNTGWTTSPYGTSVMYTTGASYPFSMDTRLYAVWEATVKLSTDVPVRSGYTFKGWQYQSANGAEVLQPGASISLKGEITDIYVNAVWERNYREPVIESVSLVGLPEKILYQIGDVLDTRGLQVKANYSDGSTAIISQGLIISAPSLENSGIYNVTVNCEGKLLTYAIYVFVNKDTLLIEAGDVDFNGIVNSGDARYVLRASVGLEVSNGDIVLIGDINDNGVLDAGDARLILRASVELEDVSSWPIYQFGLNN
ncbi:MAG: InlB B-repeat-containing protein [Clostridia bacterium]|nr:InlB B-repeat-containing protein [Clostridia bacterium]